jgi:excisionase family DNA binding protein
LPLPLHPLLEGMSVWRAKKGAIWACWQISKTARARCLTALASVLELPQYRLSQQKLLRRRASIGSIDRIRPLSVAQAAAVLQASEAYVRRLLAEQRLFGFKVGPVWAIYAEDLESYQRLRRPPGRPARVPERPPGESDRRLRIDTERAGARTDGALRQPRRNRANDR